MIRLLRDAPRWLDATEVQWRLRDLSSALKTFHLYAKQLEDFAARPGGSLAARYAAEYAGRAAGEAFQAADRMYDPWLWDRVAYYPRRVARAAAEGREICEACEGAGVLTRESGWPEFCSDCDGRGSLAWHVVKP